VESAYGADRAVLPGWAMMQGTQAERTVAGPASRTDPSAAPRRRMQTASLPGGAGRPRRSTSRSLIIPGRCPVASGSASQPRSHECILRGILEPSPKKRGERHRNRSCRKLSATALQPERHRPSRRRRSTGPDGRSALRAIRRRRMAGRVSWRPRKDRPGIGARPSALPRRQPIAPRSARHLDRRHP
jgi:hypothetical protein